MTFEEPTFTRGDFVRFQGERYRVRYLTNSDLDVVIQNSEHTLTVGVLSVEAGW